MKHFFTTRLLACLATLLMLWPTMASAAPFTPGNLVVVRIGDGVTAPSATTNAVATYLLEYTPAGVLVQTIALPSTSTATAAALTNTTSSSSDALLTRSVDGRYLVLTGYDATAGTASVLATASTTNNRIIGRIAADGTVDVSTRVGDAFSGVPATPTSTNIRSATTVDGSTFYAVGSSSGVHYLPFGNSGTAATTAINTASPTNIRSINIFGGNLYIGAASGTAQGISQVGTGLPTTGSQTITNLPGFPTVSGPSPYAFYGADLSSTVPGIDVFYIADDRTAAPGGIQKWSLVAGTWTYNGSISSTAAVRGLDGMTSAAGVSLVASGNGGLFLVSDNAGYNAPPSTAALPAAIVAYPSNGAVFRGSAFAPVAAVAAPTITSFTPTSGAAGTTVTITGTDFTGATAVTLNGVAISGFTVVNGTTITFTVPAGATSGTIAVTTPGGTVTSTGTFTVPAPVAAPTITSLSPATAVAGGAAFTLTVTGTGFVAGSVVNFNGTALTTTYVSATSLTAAVPASAIATAGTYNVTVVNPATSGGTSAASTFTVTAPIPVPTITSFSPTSGPVGTTVTVTGTNFTGATGATLNGMAVTNFVVVSATSVTFDVPTGATSGVIAVTTPGGTATSTGTFTVSPPVVTPTISALTPNAQVVGGPALTLTITGTGFTPTSTVSFNGVTYNQTSSTATSLVVTIPASALATVGSFPVTVTNSAGTSTVLTFIVSNPSTAGAFEDFETGTKASYTVGTVTLASGTWTFSDALIGTSFADKFNGLKSARIRAGFIRMDFDKTTGAGTVIVNAALYGSDTGASFILEKSTDGGVTFTTVPGAPATLTSTLTPYTFTVNQAGNVRFRITNTTTATTRVIVDDISISNYTAPAVPTITSFTPTTGGPGTTVTVTGTNFTGATAVRIGSFTVTNFTVVSGTSITFVVPGGTGSVNGLITVVTPGGTATSVGTFNLVSATVASQALPGLTVFPNPATDRLTVTLPASGAATVALRDLAGRLVLAPAPLGADKQVLLPAGLAAGVYVLEVRQGEVFAVRRIVKN